MMQFLMTASYLDIAWKELKIARTAQVKHLFQPLLPLIYNVETSVYWGHLALSLWCVYDGGFTVIHTPLLADTWLYPAFSVHTVRWSECTTDTSVMRTHGSIPLTSA